MSVLLNAQSGSSYVPNSNVSKHVIDSLFTKGMEEAKLDLKNNIIKYKFWGLPQESDTIFEEILKEKYDIKLDFVGADLVHQEELAEWNGYNKIIKEYILKKYKKDVIQESYQIAIESIPGIQILNRDSVLSLLEIPESAKRNKIEGNVLVKFKINKYGKVINPKVVKSLGYGCDKEALRLIKLFRFRSAENVKYAEEESKSTYTYSLKLK